MFIMSPSYHCSNCSTDNRIEECVNAIKFALRETGKSGLLLKLKQKVSKILVVWSESDVLGTILDFPGLVWKKMFSTNFYCIKMYQ